MQGCAFDGQYFHCNVPEHIANILDVEPQKMIQVSFHDYGYVLNLADKDAREATQWLLNLNSKIGCILNFLNGAKFVLK